MKRSKAFSLLLALATTGTMQAHADSNVVTINGYTVTDTVLADDTYTTNTISGSGGITIEGFNNTVTDSSETSVTGLDNSVTDSSFTEIVGNENYLTTAIRTSILGSYNGSEDSPIADTSALSITGSYNTATLVANGSIIGNNNTLTGQNTESVSRSSIYGSENTVTGTNESTIIGNYNRITNEAASSSAGEVYILGNNNIIDEATLVSIIGSDNQNLGTGITSTQIIANNATVGNNVTDSFIAGTNVNVNGNYAVAIGSKASVQSDYGIAIGSESSSSEASAIAVGQASSASGVSSLAIGTLSSALGNTSVAIGNSAMALTENSLALGSSTQVSTVGGVALGSMSWAATDAGIEGYLANGNTSSTWVSTAAAVSVGNIYEDITRQITGVAAGTEDTDAVNVAQLKAASSAATTELVAGENVQITSETGSAGQAVYTINAVSTDVTELTGRVDTLNDRLDDLSDESRRGDALNAALAALKPLQYDPMNRHQFMAGIGHYKNRQAIAIGLATHPRENTLLHVGAAYAGEKHMMFNAGATWQFGRSEYDNARPARYGSGPISSIYTLQDEMEAKHLEIASLQAETAALRDIVTQQQKQIEYLLSKVN